ncbi:MAG TPA: hypothetical protein PK668_17510 [Myxococcota bacterium]|nr:hypothetical protein [Myxococcota bacterium]HRY94959.1 hypothetical protein [Myxococcota bacterium]HSA19978.1 hypothetical protein [Myxococcota bacterium]
MRPCLKRVVALGLAALWLAGCTSGKYVSIHEPERIASADSIRVTTADKGELELDQARVEGKALVGLGPDGKPLVLPVESISSIYATDWSQTRIAVALVALGILAAAVGVGAGLLAGEDDYGD